MLQIQILGPTTKPDDQELGELVLPNNVLMFVLPSTTMATTGPRAAGGGAGSRFAGAPSRGGEHGELFRQLG